jgi:hypothetical protein
MHVFRRRAIRRRAIRRRPIWGRRARRWSLRATGDSGREVSADIGRGFWPSIEAMHQRPHHHAAMVRRFGSEYPGETGDALGRLARLRSFERPHPVGVIEAERERLGYQDAADHQRDQPVRQAIGKNASQHDATSAAKT